MQPNTTAPEDLKKVPESKTNPHDGLPPAPEIVHDPQKKQVEKEVKETFNDEEIPVEPVLGNFVTAGFSLHTLAIIKIPFTKPRRCQSANRYIYPCLGSCV